MNTKLGLGLALAAVLAFASGCGGGSDAAAGASASTGGTGGAAPGTLTVSAATNAARNGSYAPTGAKFTSGSNFGYNGQTKDGKFELEVVMSPAGAILRAHVWFFDASSVRFFGCDGGKAVACTGISYSTSANQVVFTTARMAEVTPSLDGSASDVLVGGGESLTVDGAIEVK